MKKFNCIYFTKIYLHGEHLEIKGLFTRSEIPYKHIASVHESWGRVIIETSGGHKHSLAPWWGKSGKLYKAISKEIGF